MTGSSAATPAVAQRRICAALLFELCRLVKLLLLNRILLCKKILCLDCITTGIEMAEWTARTYFYFSSSIPHNLFILAIHNSNIVWIIAQNIVYPISPEGCIFCTLLHVYFYCSFYVSAICPLSTLYRFIGIYSKFFFFSQVRVSFGDSVPRLVFTITSQPIVCVFCVYRTSYSLCRYAPCPCIRSKTDCIIRMNSEKMVAKLWFFWVE